MSLSSRTARKSILLLLVAASGLGFAAGSTADERILSFHSDIEIHTDRSMTVTETIRVRAEGNQIRRGILRDFPTKYRDRRGNRVIVDFDVISVSRDDMPESWTVRNRANGVRMRIGRSGRYLVPGEHEYRIEYRTDWQIGFFDDHDELYWNVTGNDAIFPIDSASAWITLPVAVGTDNIRVEGWTGAPGSEETATEPAVINDSTGAIAARRRLGPGEGLSFAMSWPKGAIAEPTLGERSRRLLSDNRGLLIALLGFVASLVYWLRVWYAHGRDPLPGTIFPHYTPPDNVSPATARYLRRMGYDQKAFSAAIIHLAVKGYLEISEDDGEYSLQKTSGGGELLAPGEEAVMRELFRQGRTLELDNANHATVQAAMAKHRSSLKRDNYRVHFATNGLYVVPALLAAGGMLAMIGLAGGLTPLALAVLVVTALMIPVFAWLMRAHTPAGRRLLDRIEGFRLYLDVAEKDDLNLMNPPEITPRLFEKYLPYALALDVEQHWAEKFSASLPTEAAASYQPAWYHGHWNTAAGGFGGNVGAATAAVTSAVSTSIAAAATPPGSSSGLSGGHGGGFCGGGGGGGGVGGW